MMTMPTARMMVAPVVLLVFRVLLVCIAIRIARESMRRMARIKGVKMVRRSLAARGPSCPTILVPAWKVVCGFRNHSFSQTQVYDKYSELP
jgi:hypothetical protein